MKNSIYHAYELPALCLMAQQKEPVPVNLILDKTAVDFLLSLNTNNRNVTPNHVQQLMASIGTCGWKSSETLCVTNKAVLGNGQHRLMALKELGYPASVCATVVFGVDDATILTLDQHQKRSANAAIKIRTGKSYSQTLLGTVRAAIDCSTLPGRMSIGTNGISPEQLQQHLPYWTKWFEQIPLLFSSRKIGDTKFQLTSTEALAVVQYAQRAGVDQANDFLSGFFGEKEVATDSPEHKALMFRLTSKRATGSWWQTHLYRVFVNILLAHYARKRNPRIKESLHWGVLKTEKEKRYERAQHENNCNQ
jgi:hypothetical protein